MIEFIYHQFSKQGLRFYPHPNHSECEYSLKHCAWSFANYSSGTWSRELCRTTMLEF